MVEELLQQPEFTKLSPAVVFLLILFFPIGLLVFLVLTIIYLARWMCYNLEMPNIFCYIIAFLLSPIFLPLVIISFIVKAINDSGLETKNLP